MTTDDRTTTEDFEREVTRGLHDLVADAHPPPELRERLADSIHELPRAGRSWLPGVAAVVAVVALFGVFLALRDDDAVDVDVASQADAAPEIAPEDAPDTASDEAPPTTAPPAPEVTSAPVAVDDAPEPGTPPTTAGGAPAPAAGPSTTVACRNSTDPVCGPFRWDPPPRNRAATVTVEPPAGPIVSGEPVELTISMSDPDGAVTLDCYSVNLDRPGLSTGSCSITNPDGRCPNRYGPWQPPEPEPHEATTTTVVEFAETGTYEVTVDVSPADGCDNVDPYRSGATATITVEVVDSPAG